MILTIFVNPPMFLSMATTLGFNKIFFSFLFFFFLFELQLKCTIA